MNRDSVRSSSGALDVHGQRSLGRAAGRDGAGRLSFSTISAERAGFESEPESTIHQESAAIRGRPNALALVDPPCKPADPGGPWTTRTIAGDEVSDLPSESTEREIGGAREPLLALARAVDVLLAAGLIAQARPLVRQLLRALEGGRCASGFAGRVLA